MRRRVVKIFAVLFLAFLIICFICILNTEKSVSGIENFRPQYCPLGLTDNLFPDHDYPHRFPYIDADYHYYYRGLNHAYATAFSRFRYTPEQYARAKEYCLRQFSSTDEHRFRIGGYTFVEHICYRGKTAEGNWIPMCRYPEHFNMYAYHDSENVLLFLGFYNSDPGPGSVDFEAFYQEHFGKYFTLD